MMRIIILPMSNQEEQQPPIPIDRAQQSHNSALQCSHTSNVNALSPQLLREGEEEENVSSERSAESGEEGKHNMKTDCQLSTPNTLAMELQECAMQAVLAQGERSPFEGGNYMDDLVMLENLQDNFAICDEEINIGRSSINLQLKETFNILRQSIEKLLNEEELSISVVKLLPRQLEDDFNDFIGYIKEKIEQIKNENNLTFIAADMGNEPELEDISIELQDFLSKESVDLRRYQRIIEEKESLITSLLNEKTEQENTINEQQNLQEEFEKLHLQQYSVLKSEIKLKQEDVDRQLVYFESLKNVFKKMMHFWVEEDDNYDDFEDNLKLVTNICGFSQKEVRLMESYLEKYKELKDIQ